MVINNAEFAGTNIYCSISCIKWFLLFHFEFTLAN